MDNSEDRQKLSRPGIYYILNKANNHSYVGQSRNIFKRWRDHKRSLRNGTHSNEYLQNAWNLYKEQDFCFQVLVFCKEEELNDKEQYWFERIKPEYNIVKNVYEINIHLYARKRNNNDYKKQGENFTRPQWHLWVYGGARKSDFD